MRPHRFCALALMLIFSFQAGADPAAAEEDQRISPAMLEQFDFFLRSFVDGSNTPAEQASFFTDSVYYYEQGFVGKSEIIRDVERYIRHWPWRKNRLTDIDYIKRAPDSDRLFVSFAIDFEVANRAKTVAGKAHYGAVIVDVDGSPKIESIQEKLTQRKRFPALEE